MTDKLVSRLLTGALFLAGAVVALRRVWQAVADDPRPLTDAERREALTLIVTNADLERRYRLTQPGHPERHQQISALRNTAATIRAAERMGEIA